MEYFSFLKSTKIFAFADEFECQAMMYCFKTRFKMFDKSERIVSAGEPTGEVVLILKGSAIIENIDSLGEISIISRVGVGDIFGLEEINNSAGEYKNSLVAKEKCFVMFMNAHRLLNMCDNKCRRHQFVIRNILELLNDRNRAMFEKLQIMAKKSTREKLLAYFSLCAEKANNSYFEIPFNKTELANYLSVDRSAMSSELSKLRQEGIIDYDKKEYHLKKGKEDF